MTIEEYIVSELTRLSDRVKKADEVIREQERKNKELEEQLESSKKYAEKRQMASANFHLAGSLQGRVCDHGLGGI